MTTRRTSLAAVVVAACVLLATESSHLSLVLPPLHFGVLPVHRAAPTTAPTAAAAALRTATPSSPRNALQCAAPLRPSNITAFLVAAASEAPRSFPDVVLPLVLTGARGGEHGVVELVQRPQFAPNAHRDYTTLCFCATTARVSTLALIMRRWNGPVSVSVFFFGRRASDALFESKRTVDTSRAWLEAACEGFGQCLARSPSTRPFPLALSFVFESSFPHIEAEWPFAHDRGEFLPHVFPINLLRNVAIRNSELLGSDTIFVTDADMIPSLNGSALLAQELTAIESAHSNAVVVVPSFELVDEQRASAIGFPANKAQLQSTLRADRRSFVPFRMADALAADDVVLVDLLQPGGDYNVSAVGRRFLIYGPTRHGTWLRGTTAYTVKGGMSYEPYVAGRRSRLPLFSPFFYDRSINFSVWSRLLRLMNQTFAVQPSVFVVHHPHDKRITRKPMLSGIRNVLGGALLAAWQRAHSDRPPSGENELQHCRSRDARRLVTLLFRALCTEVLRHPALRVYVDDGSSSACDDRVHANLFAECESDEAKSLPTVARSPNQRFVDSLPFSRMIRRMKAADAQRYADL